MFFIYDFFWKVFTEHVRIIKSLKNIVCKYASTVLSDLLSFFNRIVTNYIILFKSYVLTILNLNYLLQHSGRA